jgi:putative transcriptional regulator
VVGNQVIRLLAAGLWLLAATAVGQDAPNGVVLVAKPSLVDPNFRETVVLVTRHPGGGAVGIILNRPTRVPVAQLLPEHEGLRGRPDHLFAGGPVSPRALIGVFRSTERPEASLRVLADVYLTLDGAFLDGLLRRADAPRELRLYAGYAGWAPGQLEAEIARDDWYVLEPDLDTIFRADPVTLWRELLRRASARSTRAGPAERPRLAFRGVTTARRTEP